MGFKAWVQILVQIIYNGKGPGLLWEIEMCEIVSGIRATVGANQGVVVEIKSFVG